ncbi:MAG TPA: TIGR03808 family TAT-translocated repetitive protein [Xanthobacteraceae bacterium]|nr:TIGR03808 family TAT-translocated repetitive protein [Xanthobacteraceae bacterium]
MDIDRRHLLRLGAVAASAAIGASPTGASALPALAAPSASPIGALGLDAAHFGLHPGSPDDQSRALQGAIDAAARARAPLAIAPGLYRAGNLQLPAGAQVCGVRGATQISLTQGHSLLAAAGADHVTLSGLVLDGGKRPLGDAHGLINLENCHAVRIVDCELLSSGGHGIRFVAVDGEVSGTTLTDTADVAILSYNAAGLLLARNTIIGAGNNGIQIIRWETGDDGTIVADNRIENVANRSGGSGQYGNAINAFRAGNVIVRSNRIRHCAFSAVRGNAAANIQIDGNSISDAGEVALYAEFGFEGAIIANNSVEGAAIGVSVTNFNDGGRLAVVQGNIIRNLKPQRPAGTDPGDSAGIGISVEADTAVAGNVIENAPLAGIMLGWGRYLRDVAATGNVVRKADIGIAVSVAPGSASTLVADNVITDSARGAIVGMAGAKAVTADLAQGGAEIYPHLSISGNRVR